MKKFIALVSLFIVWGNINAFAQQVENLLYPPDVAAFVENAGALLVKDVYNIETSKLGLKVIILTDFDRGSKIGYVQYRSADSANNAGEVLFGDGIISSFSSSLDAEEIPYCVSCLEIARDKMLKTKPDGDVSYLFYDTRLGGRIGVKGTPALIGKSGSWEAFFNADPYQRDEYERIFPLGGGALQKIIDAFWKAWDLIQEKTSTNIPAYQEPAERISVSPM